MKCQFQNLNGQKKIIKEDVMDILDKIKQLKYADTFKRVELIKKGWSADDKYIIHTSNNKKLFTQLL